MMCLMICFTIAGCSRKIEKIEIVDIRIFKDTPAWSLAKAVDKQDIKKIEEILLLNPNIVDYQEPTFGATMLLWAVGMEKYESAKKLLEYGANPNLATFKYGDTPLIVASNYSWIDNEAKKDPKYVKLLLDFGADPNLAYIGYSDPKLKSFNEPGTTPLMATIGSGIDKTKALVEAGADINQKSSSQSTAAIYALIDNRDPIYAYYLIVEKKAIVSEPYYGLYILSDDNPNETFLPVDILRTWVFDIDSEEYRLKMEIVKEFERQGVDYWSTEIPDRILDRIIKLYPDTWEEYILKY